MSLKDIIKTAKKKKKENYERAVEDRWTGTKIKDLLEKNDAFIERCLCVLLARQTSDEVLAENTGHNNNMGFTATDAKFLTSLAKQIIANTYDNVEGKRLSRRQMFHARKGILKYSRQLAHYANYQEMIKIEKAIGVRSNDSDFTKGGTFRKVDFGDKKTTQKEESPLEDPWGEVDKENEQRQ